jgi:hypothetical protein
LSDWRGGGRQCVAGEPAGVFGKGESVGIEAQVLRERTVEDDELRRGHGSGSDVREEFGRELGVGVFEAPAGGVGLRFDDGGFDWIFRLRRHLRCSLEHDTSFENQLHDVGIKFSATSVR